MASTIGTRLSSLAVASVVSGLLACGSTTKTTYVDEPIPEEDAGFVVKPDPDSGLGELAFRPERLFSGVDGTRTFQVPVAVYDSGNDLEITASKPASVTIAPKKLARPTRNDGTTDNGKYFFVTVKEAGTITLTARSGGKTTQATLTVTQYDPGRWALGDTRYRLGPQGGGSDPPCTQCHVNGDAIDHSPAALASVTDEAIAAVITTGISTSGFPIKIGGVPGHKWDVEEPVLGGLVTYLRALEPRGFE